MSYPLIAGGKVFVTVRNVSAFGTELYALNAADGATLWSYSLGGFSYWSAICYENGRVFALNSDGLLRAIDGDNGAVIWSQQVPGLTFTSAPTVFQGVVYVGNGSGRECAVDTSNGFRNSRNERLVSQLGPGFIGGSRRSVRSANDFLQSGRRHDEDVYDSVQRIG